jgi:DNA/RNA endonuclease YhcR with UshA esterase domain
MQTEFTCGIYTVALNKITNRWEVQVSNQQFAIIEGSGHLIRFTQVKYLSTSDLTEISVLMNNIKRQYKQLQTI